MKADGCTGIDVMEKTVDIDGARVKLQVVDVSLCNLKHCFRDFYLRCRLLLDTNCGTFSSSAMISLKR